MERTQPLHVFALLTGLSLLLLFRDLDAKSISRRQSTPEPACDPLAPLEKPTLTLVSAGRPKLRSRIPEVILHETFKVCPDNFPRGFSIRCDGGPTGDGVKGKFFVDGRLWKIEIRKPYYLRGDYNSFVVPWDEWEDSFTVGDVKVVECRVGGESAGWDRVGVKLEFGC